MFFNALIQVSACAATFNPHHNALLVHNKGGGEGFAFFWLHVRSDISACAHGMDIFSDSNIILTGVLLSSHVCLDLTKSVMWMCDINSHTAKKTMLNRAFKLSSNWQMFHLEYERLTQTFS